jgi:hypothetical protein
MTNMRALVLLNIVLAIGFLVGCGKKDEQSSPATAAVNTCETRAAEFQNASTYICYDYKENSCDTTKKEFSSGESYCSTLQDDSANHGCAHDKRMADYQKNCT